MRFSKLALVGIIPIAAIIFFACQKADLKSPTLTSDGRGGGGGVVTTAASAFILTAPVSGTACNATDGDFCFDAYFTNNGGNDPGGVNNSVSISVYSGTTLVEGSTVTVTGTSGHFCVGSNLAPATYTIKVTYSHTPSEHADAVNGDYSFPLTVNSSENCGGGGLSCSNTGVSFTRTANITASENMSPLGVTVHYTVTNCGGPDLRALKLQGGLVNKATLTATPTWNGDADASVVYTPKQTGGNLVLSWTFDLASGESETFHVSYNVAYPVPHGSPLTGPWSVKIGGVTYGDGNDIDPATGYMYRLYYL